MFFDQKENPQTVNALPISLLLIIITLLTGCSPNFIPAEEWETTAGIEGLPETPREMRAVWIATVANIDWPSQPGLSAAEQKAELRAMFDRVKMLNMNTVIFQVRPATDALYQSEFEPWSEYLTGKQGQAPEPFYDPLEFAVEEAHKRGLELHAWINPFRARHSSGSAEMDEMHLIRKHPHLVRDYGSHLWLDPGHPESLEWSVEVIRDIVNRYDVDGVHIDDYFYPYKERDENGNLIDFPDSTTYSRYIEEYGEIDRNDWRRLNVDRFVQRMHMEIREADPSVRFGISPIGLWRPDHQGDEIWGFDAYEEIYADSRKWFNEGWLDYFTPQLYWPVNQDGQRYKTLVEWWHGENNRNRHFWPGNFTSRTGYGEDLWPATEITDQIHITRDFDGTSGNVHFSMRILMMNPNGLLDSMMELYDTPALVPETHWLNEEVPGKPEAELTLVNSRFQLDFRPATGDEVWLYVVKVRYGNDWEISVLPGWKQHLSLESKKGRKPVNAVAVTAVNRTGGESLPAVISH